MTDHQFERTTRACAECVACCKEQPGPLAVGDLERIAAFLGRPAREVLGKFWASPGAILMDALGQIQRVPTITPRMHDGRCVFLDADDRCRIHPVAPFGCAYFDTHMPPAAWQPRGLWLYRKIMGSAIYQSVRATLRPATSWRPRTGHEERRDGGL